MPFALRTNFAWRLRTRTLALGPRTLLMGILNVTPDSFSDGGRFSNVASAVECALEMLDQGADIIDIGGESTRPGSTPIAPAEEQARMLPVLRAILHARPEAILSIDTWHAETAQLAVEAGAEIVNDVSGHLWDDRMSAACAALACGAILMHTRGRPQQWRTLPALAPGEVLPLVLDGLQARAHAALATGIAPESIVLDPGFGFGKAFDENYPLLAHFETLSILGFPLLAGVSRKSFLTRIAPAKTTAAAPEQESPAPLGTSSSSGVGSESPVTRAGLDTATLVPTTAANTAAILAGAHILRVHDILPAREAAAVADRILRSARA